MRTKQFWQSLAFLWFFRTFSITLSKTILLSNWIFFCKERNYENLNSNFQSFFFKNVTTCQINKQTLFYASMLETFSHNNERKCWFLSYLHTFYKWSAGTISSRDCVFVLKLQIKRPDERSESGLLIWSFKKTTISLTISISLDID